MSEKLAIKLFGSHARPERNAGGRAVPDDTQRAFHEYLDAQQGSRAMREHLRQNDVTNSENPHQQRSQAVKAAESKADEAETDAHPAPGDNALDPSDLVADAQRGRVRAPLAQHHVSRLVSEAQMNGRKIPPLNDSAQSGEAAQADLLRGVADAGIDIVRATSVQDVAKHFHRSLPLGLEYSEQQSDGTKVDTGGLDSSGENFGADAVGTGAVYAGMLPSSDGVGQEDSSFSKASGSRLIAGAADSELLAESGFGPAYLISGAVEASVSNERDKARLVREGISNTSDMRSEALAKVQPKFGEMPARRLQSEMAIFTEGPKTGSVGEKPQAESVALIGHSSSGAGEKLAFAARLLEPGNSTMSATVTPAFGDTKGAVVVEMPVMVPVDTTGDDALRILANTAIGNAAPAKARNPVTDRLGPVVWAQVVEGIRNSSMRSLQIQLAPVELGRVRITMNPTEWGVQVVITAERLETLDLMRKFSADFEKALADIGYQQLDMTFSHQQTADQNSFESTKANSPDEAFAEGPAEQLHYRLVENGMDIRI